MEEVMAFFREYVTFKQILITLSVLAIVSLLRFIFLRVIRKSKTLGREAKRRLRVNSNSIFTFIFIVSVVLIWANEIQTVALSFVAFGVAIVLATKEMILCFMGGVYKAANNLFHIGDRIEVNGIRGIVIGKTMLSTKLLEVGPGYKTHQYTGRSITVPNSLFILHNVINESFTHDFLLHTFSVPLTYNADWKKAKEILSTVSQEACSGFLEAAKKYMDRIEERENIEAPDVKPIIHINFVDHEHMELIVRITIPSSERGKLEQQIKHAFLNEFDGWNV